MTKDGRNALDRYSRTYRIYLTEQSALDRCWIRARRGLEWMQRNRDYAAVLVAMAAGAIGLTLSALGNL